MLTGAGEMLHEKKMKMLGKRIWVHYSDLRRVEGRKVDQGIPVQSGTANFGQLKFLSHLLDRPD